MSPMLRAAFYDVREAHKRVLRNGVTASWWRWGRNGGASLAWRALGPTLVGEAARVARDLALHGIATTHVDALLGGRGLFDELRDEVARLEVARASAIEHARAKRDERSPPQRQYRTHLLGDAPVLDEDSVFARFALREELLSIAGEHLRMYPLLRYFTAQRTFVSRPPPREAQLFHRDNDDREMVKVFLSLDDVAEDDGPLCYVPGTHARGAQGRLRCREVREEGGLKRRVLDEEMARHVPRERWRSSAGPAGTLTFADTSGYHHGERTFGDRERLVFMAAYVSRGSPHDGFARRTPGASTQTVTARLAARRGTALRALMQRSKTAR